MTKWSTGNINVTRINDRVTKKYNQTPQDVKKIVKSNKIGIPNYLIEKQVNINGSRIYLSALTDYEGKVKGTGYSKFGKELYDIIVKDEKVYTPYVKAKLKMR